MSYSQVMQFAVNGDPTPAQWLQALGLNSPTGFIRSTVHEGRVWLEADNLTCFWIGGVRVEGGVATVFSHPVLEVYSA